MREQYASSLEMYSLPDLPGEITNVRLFILVDGEVSAKEIIRKRRRKHETRLNVKRKHGEKETLLRIRCLAHTLSFSYSSTLCLNVPKVSCPLLR